MAKAKTAFVCNDCGADFPKWQGQCGECHAWNTLSEIRLTAPTGKKTAARSPNRSGFAGTKAAVQRLDEVAVKDLPRLASGFDEFDRVLGGGFVPGSSTLIGGHPGAGKPAGKKPGGFRRRSGGGGGGGGRPKAGRSGQAA